MIRITKIYEDGTYEYEADTKEEEQLFENILKEAFKLAYRKGYHDGYDQAQGEYLLKIRKVRNDLLSKGISPISV